jgi:hypothetical protein
VFDFAPPAGFEPAHNAKECNPAYRRYQQERGLRFMHGARMGRVKSSSSASPSAAIDSHDPEGHTLRSRSYLHEPNLAWLSRTGERPWQVDLPELPHNADLVLSRADSVRMPANAQMHQFCICARRIAGDGCLALLAVAQEGTYVPGSPSLAPAELP